jgi:predicted nucleic acid-binding protein
MTEQSPAAIVYLDAMAFIFSIEGKPEVSEPVKALFEALRNRPGAAATSELTLAEVLAGSERSRSPPIKRAYLDLIVWSKFLDLVPVSRHILYESAELRFIHKKSHKKKLKLPDAIHLVTAIQRRCRYFVSADKGIRPPVDMKRVAPDINGVTEIQEALA